MGNRTLIEINHDSFSDVYGEKLIEDLNRYVRSGDPDDAKRLQASHGVRIISTRHSDDPYYVSGNTDGFPTQLPYEEQLDRENQEWANAVDKARRLLGGTLRLRTIADLRDVIAKLLKRVPPQE